MSSQKKLALFCVYVPDAPANTTEPVVNAVDVPVPPLPTASVPPKVTPPVVAVFGVNPVLPALKLVTAPKTSNAAAFHADPVHIYN